MVTRRDALLALGAVALGVPAGCAGTGPAPRGSTCGAADCLAPVDPALRERLAATVELQACSCTLPPLCAEGRLFIVRQALLLVEHNYVNLPLKRQMHAVDPVGKLRLLQRALATGADPLEDGEYHRELLDILRPVRDRHMVYRLPACHDNCVAFLPFLVEEIQEDGLRKYIVARRLKGAADPSFGVGAEIVSWNGSPIRRAVANHASWQAGTSPDARRALAVKALTLRKLRQDGIPDEPWVVVGYRSAAGALLDQKFFWTLAHLPDVKPRVAAREPQDIDHRLAVLQRTERVLFPPERQETAQPARGAPRGVCCDALAGASFCAGLHVQGNETFGYLRIVDFGVDGKEDDFVEEFVRLLKQMPPSGLILDIRGNPGGQIEAAERILQALTQRRPIEPELFQFRNTPLNLAICERDDPNSEDKLHRWIASIKQGLQTGDVYSAAFPKTEVGKCNSMPPQYSGPVVLITSALSYSAADFFAAGFQDHGIGPILGVHRRTGAGGANQWGYNKFSRLVPEVYKSLPPGVSFNAAMRRGLRVGLNAGRILEDFGVEPDAVQERTRNDVLNCDADLLAKAVSMLRNRPRR